MRKAITCLMMSCSLYLIVQSQTARAEDWYNPSWAYRRLITIDHTKVNNVTTPSTTYADYPLLVYATGLSNINADGTDIRFTSSDGVTELPREIESYSSGTLYAWVKFTLTKDSGDSTDDTIYMYYGNSAAAEPAVTDTYGARNVWNSNYKMVQHLKDTTTSTTTNSNSAVNNGTKKAADEPIETASGKIYKGQDFDGTNDYIGVGNDNLNITGNTITFQVWAYPEVLGEKYIISKFNGDTVTNGYSFLITSSQIYFRLGNGSTMYQFNPSHGMSINNWYYLVAVYDGATMKIYKNGSAISGSTTFTGSIGTNSNNVSIGQRINGAYFWNGVMDELRISSGSLSVDWIATEYKNHNSPDTFCAIGGEMPCTTGNFFQVFE
jgi:hypothetical protein